MNVPLPWSGIATWLLSPPASSSKLRRSSAVRVMKAGSRDPQSSSMARRVSSCVVKGPGVNSSGDCAIPAFLFTCTDLGPAREPPQAPSGEQHHEGEGKRRRDQQAVAPAVRDDRSQQIEQIVEVEAERPRIGLAAGSFQSLQVLRPPAGEKKRRAGPQAERDGGASPWPVAHAQPERDEEG